MLIRFICENFLSFGKEIDLNLTAASAETQHPDHLRHPVESRKERVLRAAALYGANASGKSNLVKALEFARNLIVKGTQPNRPIPGLFPFKLRKDAGEEPSRFEFIVCTEGRLYEYGFVISRETVVEEWLYDQSTTRERLLFERTTEMGESAGTQVKIGPHLARKASKGRQILEFIAGSTRPNQLFLREAIERDVKELLPVYRWFDSKLVFMSPQSRSADFARRISSDSQFREFAENFLAHIDSGITAIGVKALPFDFTMIPEGIPETLRESILTRLDSGEAVNLGDHFAQSVLVRENGKGLKAYMPIFVRDVDADPARPVGFLLDEESAGTLRVIDFLYPLFTAGSEEVSLVVDELDSSLHPLLTRRLVEYFLNHTKSNSQLVFTTHEAHLLDLDLLRRDEIWFIEKDKAQSSRLYSLVEFKPRKDLRIEKGYLHGRFGGIPFLGDSSWLDLNEDAVAGGIPETSE